MKDLAGRTAVITGAGGGTAHGEVNLLVNNAGVGGGGYVWETSEKEWRWVLGVNLMGVVHALHHFIPRMLAANARGEPGHVVNTASIAGWLATPMFGVYNVSKHAVVALTETLHHDLRMAGATIGVTLLCFTHPQIMASVRARHDAVHAGAPPADPYGQRPDRRPGVTGASS
jgi:NAD(P)-dependent dehydrogenase (short-subunit alcohol dehydrogenase family)